MMRARTLLPVAALLAAGPALAEERGDPEKGLAYAQSNCAECHDVRRGQFDSPVFEAPAFQDIGNADGMSEIALYAFFRTSHPSMPNLIVPPEHIADLTAYLLAIRKHR